MSWKEIFRGIPGLTLALAWFVGCIVTAVLMDAGVVVSKSLWVAAPIAVCEALALTFILWPRISLWAWEFVRECPRLQHFIAKHLTKEID